MDDAADARQPRGLAARCACPGRCRARTRRGRPSRRASPRSGRRRRSPRIPALIAATSSRSPRTASAPRSATTWRRRVAARQRAHAPAVGDEPARSSAPPMKPEPPVTKARLHRANATRAVLRSRPRAARPRARSSSDRWRRSARQVETVDGDARKLAAVDHEVGAARGSPPGRPASAARVRRRRRRWRSSAGPAAHELERARAPAERGDAERRAWTGPLRRPAGSAATGWASAASRARAAAPRARRACAAPSSVSASSAGSRVEEHDGAGLVRIAALEPVRGARRALASRDRRPARRRCRPGRRRRRRPRCSARSAAACSWLTTTGSTGHASGGAPRPRARCPRGRAPRSRRRTRPSGRARRRPAPVPPRPRSPAARRAWPRPAARACG